RFLPATVTWQLRDVRFSSIAFLPTEKEERPHVSTFGNKSNLETNQLSPPCAVCVSFAAVDVCAACVVHRGTVCSHGNSPPLVQDLTCSWSECSTVESQAQAA
ncbi:hypothetical protein KIL84_009481, partial [Mauremys mutica]